MEGMAAVMTWPVNTHEWDVGRLIRHDCANSVNDSTNSIDDSKASIFIVPGAWHPPAAYDPLVTQLNNAGYSTFAASLPSLNPRDPFTATCSADAESVREQLLPLIETEERDLIVLCHSYGGIPAGGAAKGLSKSARLLQEKRGGIIGLVYLTAFIVPEKISLLTMMGGKYAPYVHTNQPSEGLATVEDVRNVFFNDLGDDQAESLLQLLGPQALAALESEAPPPAWAEPDFAGKLAFVRCTEDQALPLFIQDMFTQRSGLEWVINDLEASHSPFASKPEELVEVLNELAQYFSD